MRPDGVSSGSDGGSGRPAARFEATLFFRSQLEPELMYFDSLDDLHRVSTGWAAEGVWVDLDSGYGSYFPPSQLLKVEVKPLFP